MNLWERIKQAFRNLMAGRHGVDQLSVTLVWVGLGLYILAAVLNVGIISLLSLALYGYTIFRMFSRNEEKRAAENRRYLTWKNKWQTAARQARTRFKNRKQYKYFKCPQCGVRLRLTRGCGEKNIVCSQCKHTFHVKA